MARGFLIAAFATPRRLSNEYIYYVLSEEMLRLAHRIHDQRYSPGINLWGDQADEVSLKNFLHFFSQEDCVHILADNVEEYKRSQIKDDHTTKVPFPTFLQDITPPFKNCFIEFDCPENKLFLQQGWSCRTFHKDDKEAVAVEKIEMLADVEWEWITSLTTINTVHSGQCLLTGDILLAVIKKDGSLEHVIIDQGGLCGEVSQRAPHLHPNSQDLQWIYFSAFFLTPLMTFNFMNYRNIDLVDITNEVGPPQKWLRRRRQPQLKYQTVTIDPMRPRRSRRGNRSGVSEPTKRSRHLCGGYRREYKPETSKGMFGRGIYGTFWIKEHWRGNAKHGMIKSTYNVLAPRESENETTT